LSWCILLKRSISFLLNSTIPQWTRTNSLGVHATLDASNQVRFGPDVEWLPHETKPDQIDYQPDESRGDSFYGMCIFFLSLFLFDRSILVFHALLCLCCFCLLLLSSHFFRLFTIAYEEAIRTYWPHLPDDSLTADYTGVRPKLCHPNVPGSGFGQFQDFYIASPDEHGIPGLVHLFGMESPGLTSCIAIADHVANLILRKAT
jgi:L-2-hydroxyglutarate oxidase LhgO